MFKPDQPTTRDFQSLKNSSVHGYFAQAYAEVREMLVTQRDPEVLYTLQGQAQAFRHVLGMIDEGFSTNGKRG